MRSLFLFFILCIHFSFQGCIETESTVIATDVKDALHTDTTAIQIDTNNYLYEFIQIVAKDQELDYSYGLSLEVENSLHLENDEAYLSTFIKKSGQKKVYYPEPSYSNHPGRAYKADSSVSFIMKIPDSLVSNPLTSFTDHTCLTKYDIKYMMSEKIRLQKLTWNNQRLGFTLSNQNNWYAFSLPYFSKDKKTVFISIRSLCSGLCGNGNVLCYQFKNNTWTSTKVDSWWH